MSRKYLQVLALILYLVACGLPVAAQYKQGRTKSIPDPPIVSADLRDYECVRRPVSLQEQRKKYPFNRARRVVLASFFTPDTPLFPVDSLGMRNYDYNYVHLPFDKDEGTKVVIDETVTLEKDQIDSLTAILYGYGYRDCNLHPPRAISACYAPHNAILFYNERNECFAFIELCFSCKGMRESNWKIDAGNFCIEKYEILRSFFQKNQVRVGITQVPLVKLCCDALK